MTDIPKALAIETNPTEAEYLTQQLGQSVTLVNYPDLFGTLADDQLADVAILIPFIHSHIGAPEMARMPALRLIATRSTGYDHIDLAAAAARGVVVANVPGYGENAVAEHTFALILTLSRKIDQAIARARAGDYTLEGLRGFDLYGKTLGVIGAGAIGLHTIRIGKGFGMRVLAFDTHQSSLLAEVIGFSYVALAQLLAESDIVSLHAPALPSTFHLINRETLSQMKRGALLINTARGTLVDTEALTWALDSGILGGAGLDALEGEEFLQREEELLAQAGWPGAEGVETKLRLLLSNHRLQRHPNVVMTPHIAFNTDEALRRILDTTIANVKAYLQGTPTHVVSDGQ